MSPHLQAPPAPPWIGPPLTPAVHALLVGTCWAVAGLGLVVFTVAAWRLYRAWRGGALAQPRTVDLLFTAATALMFTAAAAGTGVTVP